MNREEKKIIADSANMIVGGYSFTKDVDTIRVVNLNIKEPHSMVMTLDGKMLESSMDPIEQTIVLDIWNKDREFMEV